MRAWRAGSSPRRTGSGVADTRADFSKSRADWQAERGDHPPGGGREGSRQPNAAKMFAQKLISAARRPPPPGTDSIAAPAHAAHPRPDRRTARRHRPAPARLRPAQHCGAAARQPRRLLRDHAGPDRLDLLPRLLPRHLRRPQADPAHGPYPRLRLLRRHRRGLHPAARARRPSLVLDGAARTDRHEPGRLLRGDRELAQRPDRARTPRPGVRGLHDREPRRARRRPAAAAPGHAGQLHPVRGRGHVRLPVAAAGDDDALPAAADRHARAPAPPG